MPMSAVLPAKQKRYLRIISIVTGLSVLALAAYIVFGQLDIEIGPQQYLAFGVLTGIIALSITTAIKYLRALSHINEREEFAAKEVEELRRQVRTAEAILKSEPQVLVIWEPNGEPNVALNTLPESLGLPDSSGELLRFRGWLEPDSATDLEVALNNLFRQGTAFNISVKTMIGGNLEADGRASGSRLVVKFRDLAGRRSDWARMVDQYRSLTRDITSHRTLLDAIPMPVWFRRSDGRLEWVNKSFAAIVGSESQEVVVKDQVELLESRQLRSVQETLEGGRVFQERLHTVLAGERHAFDVLVLPLGEKSAGVAIDVEALESAEGDLDRHLAAHIRTLDRVSTAVAIFDSEQKLIFFNQAYLDLWQLDAQWLESGPRDGEILDRLRSRNSLPEQADYRLWKVKQLECYQSADTREDWWYLPDGRAILIVGEQRPGGGVTYLYDDATERLELESRYNSLFNVQRETLENLREGVAVFGSDGRLRLYNRAFASIWKLNWAELNSEPHIDDITEKCSVLHDDDGMWLKISRAITAIYDTRDSFDGQLERSDQSIIAFASQPLPDGGTLLTFVDVTDRKRAETMLIERNEALEAADRLKNDFIQNVSYELRTPLTSIKGFSELLGANIYGQLNERQTEYVSNIQVASDSLHMIIDQILDLASIDAGGFELKLESLSVEEIIRAAAMGVRERLIQSEIQLEIEVDETVDTLVADQKRLVQILYNLLCNAIGFSGKSSQINLVCRRKEKFISFSVIDRGPGIPEEQQSTIFKRFESHSQGSKHRGAGLGLSMVKSLVELHGGNVDLESTVGIGTTVTVSFPEVGPQRNDSLRGEEVPEEVA